MSYYDDEYDEYDDYDDYDDECSSEDDIFYHNYSVDYANQILGGHHAISSCLPRMRRRHRRYLPQLVRVSTLDQMPVVHRQQMLPSMHSQPKYGADMNMSSPPFVPPRLPTLEATSEELERRAMGRTQPIPQVTINTALPTADDDNNPSSENRQQPMTEAELRQVQQQQEAFQQHLLNMQRHLAEQQEQQQQQQEQQQEQQVPTPATATSRRFEKRREVSFHNLERDDDQAEIADLIERDPYFAAAMEDFVQTHGLLNDHRHRTHSNYSSSRHSQHSQHLCKRHRSQYCGNNSRLHSPMSSSSVSDLTNVTPELKGSNTDLVLFRELHGIRLLMQEFVQSQRNTTNPSQPSITIMPVPWPMSGGPIQTPTGVHYPPVPPVTDYQPSMVPRQQVRPPEPNQILYQNIINTVKEVIDRRSPSQREEPLKPSQIDSKLKGQYTRRPRIPSSNTQSAFMQRPPLPPYQQQQQQRRRRSSQMSSSSMGTPPPPPASNIPRAPPYEPLANFTSSRSALNQDRNLSYGSRQKESNIYDTLQPGRYLNLYTHKYN